MDLRWLFLSTAFVVSIEGWFVMSQWIVFYVYMHGILYVCSSVYSTASVSGTGLGDRCSV